MADQETNSTPSLEGRVAIVTGAAAGLGKAEAIGLAKSGATIVLNDVDKALAASDVKDIIEASGGKAVCVVGDIAERTTADELIVVAEKLGGLNIVINNAGIVRDRMLFNMSDEEWDAVIRVHLRGHFLLTRNAAALWRDKSKSSGENVYGRLVNTSSEAGLLGPEGQPNYGSAKAGITALTLSASRALARYGVRANVICPRARTAMTESVFGAAPVDDIDPLSPEHVVSLVNYLVSPAAEMVNGQVFIVYGPMVALMAAPTVEQQFIASGNRWEPRKLSTTLEDYFADRDPQKTFSASASLNFSQ
ncbi:MAG: 3-oxoacyl-ACP reductase [Mycobacteriaceae bacterium]